MSPPGAATSTTPAPYELYDDFALAAPTADTVSTPGS
jgi:hypothetical protein